MKSMHCDEYTGVIILIVDFIIINYILEEFIFEKKRLNEISKNKLSSKITRYTVLMFKNILEFFSSYICNIIEKWWYWPDTDTGARIVTALNLLTTISLLISLFTDKTIM